MTTPRCVYAAFLAGLGIVLVLFVRMFCPGIPRTTEKSGRRRTRAAALPLRRHVDMHSIQGVERRQIVRDLGKGRALLRRLGDLPAMLVPRLNAWYLYSGRHLSAIGVDDSQPGAVPVEYTFAGRPTFRKVAVVARDVQPPPPTHAEHGPPRPLGDAERRAPAQDPRLVAVASLGTLDNQAVRTIRAFLTLDEAVESARIGPDAEGRVDHIVGGRLHHPVYYVVSAVPTQSPVSAGSETAWVRRQ